MKIKKVSNSKTDLHNHSRSPVMEPFDRPHTFLISLYDFLLVFHCNYVSTMHRFRDIITYLPKFKDVT